MGTVVCGTSGRWQNHNSEGPKRVDLWSESYGGDGARGSVSLNVCGLCGELCVAQWSGPSPKKSAYEWV